MLTLYYYNPACSVVSHIALEESGLAYEAQLARPDVPEERAAVVSVNPKGTVPTLKVGDTGLTENIAIVSYVAEHAPEAQLMPRDTMARAQCLSFLSWCSSSVHVSFRQFARPIKFSKDELAHEGLKSSGLALFWSLLQQIDQRLERGPWVMGDQFTVADGYPLAFYAWGEFAELPMKDLSAYERFKMAMLERPTVRRVLEREESTLLR